MEQQHPLAFCGIYCGQCTAFHGKVANRAKELKHLIEKDLTWAKEAQEFNYDETLKGLAWLAEQTHCAGCRQEAQEWCDVKKCKKIRDHTIENCLLCDEFPTCKLTHYIRTRYSYLLKDFEQVQEIGLEEYAKIQNQREEAGIRIQDIRDY
jgi:hypothetical protein